jgi:integral membrane protein
VTSRSLGGSLLRYRVIAYITGVLINVLFFVGLPLQVAGHSGVVHVVGTAHGGFFIIYCLTILDLGFRCRWPIIRIGLVMLAGIAPVMTFVAERIVVRRVADGSWAPAP